MKLQRRHLISRRSGTKRLVASGSLSTSCAYDPDGASFRIAGADSETHRFSLELTEEEAQILVKHFTGYLTRAQEEKRSARSVEVKR